MSPPEIPLELDDLLREILIRLPPRPSSLPRASLVCVRWHRIIFDSQFLHRFRAHHRHPLLLGLFHNDYLEYSFDSALDPPDCISAAQFSMPMRFRDNFHGCRHGLGVLVSQALDDVIVWDPLTGRKRRVAFPEWFPKSHRLRCRNAAVMCAADEAGHVHGDCYLSPFKLVLMRDDHSTRACAYIYESKYGSWSTIVPTTPIPRGIRAFRPSILVQNTLYWELDDGTILELDLQKHCLYVIQKPRDAHIPKSRFRILRTTQNRLGFAITTGESIELWERRTNYHGIAEWVLEKTVELDKVLPREASSPLIMHFIEDTNMILMYSIVGHSLFTIHLELLQCKYFGKREHVAYYPYANFYTGLEKVAKYYNYASSRIMYKYVPHE